MTSQKIIKAAFLGGSVTYGYTGASGKCEKPYCDHTIKLLKAAHPDTEFIFHNFGISGTACLMGMIFTAKKLKDFQPDIVFVEYSINETRSAESIAYFEGLMRNILSLDSRPAVVPVCLFTDKGYSCEDFMEKISSHYGTGFCGLYSEIYCNPEKRAFYFEKCTTDGAHLNAEGQKYISDYVFAAAEKALISDKNKTLAEAEFSCLFDNMRQLNFCDFSECICSKEEKDFYGFDNVMRFEEGSIIKADAEFRTLSCAYIQSSDESFGDAEILIDGKPCANIQSRSIFGWGNPCVSLIFKNTKTEKHHIEIRINNGCFLTDGLYIS